MKFSLLTLFLLSLLSFSAMAGCTYSLNQDLTVSWTGYKFPGKDKRVGVSGVFTKSSLSPVLASSIQGMLKGVTATVDSQSINSNKASRDQKLASVFFKMANTKLQGKILSVDKKHLTLEFLFNGVKKKVDAYYSIKDSMLTASGSLDVLAFGMKKQLIALTKACFAKHKGKTWSDVHFKLEASFKKNCH